MKTKYRLQVRNYSSNVVEELISLHPVTKKEKWKVIVCPTMKKSKGDNYANFILNALNNNQ